MTTDGGKRLIRLVTLLVITEAIWGASIAAGRCDAVADFYRGRSISLVIGFGAGGGYDAYARLLARHIGRHIPGSPSLVAQNMQGAGGLKATQFLYDVAPRDGTVIGTVARGQPLAPLLLGNTSFDATRFTWIGSVTDEASPFNECAHAYLAAAKAVLMAMRAMPREAHAAGEITRLPSGALPSSASNETGCCIP